MNPNNKNFASSQVNMPRNGMSDNNHQNNKNILNSQYGNNMNAFKRNLLENGDDPSKIPLSHYNNNVNFNNNNNMMKGTSNSSPINYSIRNPNFQNTENGIYKTNNNMYSSEYANGSSNNNNFNSSMMPNLKMKNIITKGNGNPVNTNMSNNNLINNMNYTNFPNKLKGNIDDINNKNNYNMINTNNKVAIPNIYRNMDANNNNIDASTIISSNTSSLNTQNGNKSGNLNSVKSIDLVNRNNLVNNMRNMNNSGNVIRNNNFQNVNGNNMNNIYMNMENAKSGIDNFKNNSMNPNVNTMKKQMNTIGVNGSNNTPNINNNMNININGYKEMASFQTLNRTHSHKIDNSSNINNINRRSNTVGASNNSVNRNVNGLIRGTEHGNNNDGNNITNQYYNANKLQGSMIDHNARNIPKNLNLNLNKLPNMHNNNNGNPKYIDNKSPMYNINNNIYINENNGNSENNRNFSNIQRNNKNIYPQGFSEKINSMPNNELNNIQNFVSTKTDSSLVGNNGINPTKIMNCMLPNIDNTANGMNIVKNGDNNNLIIPKKRKKGKDKDVITLSNPTNNLLENNGDNNITINKNTYFNNQNVNNALLGQNAEELKNQKMSKKKQKNNDDNPSKNDGKRKKKMMENNLNNMPIPAYQNNSISSMPNPMTQQTESILMRNVNTVNSATNHTNWAGFPSTQKNITPGTDFINNGEVNGSNNKSLSSYKGANIDENINNNNTNKEMMSNGDQMKVDPKYIWLFLNNEFNDNKTKYAQILPLLKHYYPNRLNDLILLLEKYSLMNLNYIINSSYQLQMKLIKNYNRLESEKSGNTNGNNPMHNENIPIYEGMNSSIYNSNAENNRINNELNMRNIESRNVENTNIDNKLLNSINNNFNNLMYNMNLDGSLGRSNTNEDIVNNKNTTKGKKSNSKENTFKDEGTKKPRKPRVSKKSQQNNNLPPLNIINGTENNISIENLQKNNELKINDNVSSVGFGVHNVNNESCDKNNDPSKITENGVAKFLEVSKSELVEQLGGNNIDNDVNKNTKVRKYRKKKKNDGDNDEGNTLNISLDAVSIDQIQSSPNINENKRKKKKKNENIDNTNEENSTEIQNLLSNDKGNESIYANKIDRLGMNSKEEDIINTQILDSIVSDYKKSENEINQGIINNNECAERDDKNKIDEESGDKENKIEEEINETKKKKKSNKDATKKEKGLRKNKTKKMEMANMLQSYDSINGINYALSEQYNNLYGKKITNIKKLCYPQNNLLAYLKEAGLYNNLLGKTNRINSMNAIRKKYKKFSFCVNKVFKKQNINDIITLNDNINNNKQFLSLFKKKDIRNLKRKNLSFFMDKLDFQKIDLLIIKRIHICMEKIKNTLGLTCVINNVEQIIKILKDAFNDRMKFIWPMIEFSNNYRLDQYFHVLGKNRNHPNSNFRDTRIVVNQNINSLIMYFNQRDIDGRMIEYLKTQMKPRKRKKKNKNKEAFIEDKTTEFFKSINTIPTENATINSAHNWENAQAKANEFAFVGYNQKRLLTQITPYDYKNILNSSICNKIFTIKWKEQQTAIINNLHYDMIPDTDEIRKRFENIYVRYMGYNEKELSLKLENTINPSKLKFSKKNKHQLKGKARKKKIDKDNENIDKDNMIKKPKRKYERVKPRKNKNKNEENNKNVMEKNENGETIEKPENVKDGVVKKKGRKPREGKNKKNKNADTENNDLTVHKGDPNKVLQASLDFMNPNMFT
ncbi:conserved Plasmodium protein, unknown function [Plasmodium yoelii]|uniref:Uncharacterized protein n=4 Tax=Plasmodium yoelii TaxID=5861 RepID=A0AAE9WYM2_PLAYO|nr:conserved Plasmodium protein, unknown function [Plasmodium yoelii]WBY58808.1 hypothetical protein Py17XNL_001105780 [Plasmodium yoelii yoelii]CDU19074.1 conserved Plasmodium protein, unknown function [Plasmodium yoelii]VTZ79659.1 conserved Plasmodium protein, unknown function [Plasmodium yoelii]|eukprot:XP_022812469.1 conserved Plasmodium protein, unknown function [Plasmodium yoelii]